jgi:hypothetical protein
MRFEEGVRRSKEGAQAMFEFHEPGSVKYPVYPVPPQTKGDAEITLIRSILRLSAIHDVVEAVRILHDEGREAFDALFALHSPTPEAPESKEGE